MLTREMYQGLPNSEVELIESFTGEIDRDAILARERSAFMKRRSVPCIAATETTAAARHANLDVKRPIR